MANAKLQDVITIKKIGEKENKFWIQDSNGEFYSSFKTYEGTNNQEYNQLLFGNHNEPFQEGDRALVTYTKTVGKDDKIYKNLKSIFPADSGSQGSPSPSQGQTPRTEANRPLKNDSDEYWDKKAYKQCLWNYWLGTKSQANLTQGEMDLVWAVFKEIEVDADRRFDKTETVLGKPATSSAKEAFDRGYERSSAKDEELSYIQQDEDIKVDSIPF